MVRPDADVWVVGAHGGAGESTLARLRQGWAPAEHAWPTPSELSGRCAAVLVARTSAGGLRSAQRALRQWASGVVGPETPLLGLILVADAPGRTPRALRDLSQHVSGGAPRTWHVGWHETWRLGGSFDDAGEPKALSRLVAEVSAAAADAAPPASITPSTTNDS